MSSDVTTLALVFGAVFADVLVAGFGDAIVGTAARKRRRPLVTPRVRTAVGYTTLTVTGVRLTGTDPPSL